MLRDQDQPAGFGKGQRAQQHAVDDAEDRGVGADAERQVSGLIQALADATAPASSPLAAPQAEAGTGGPGG